MGGFAVRAAIALGINMRNDSSRTPDTSKEIRYRVWWSLYYLEHQLSLLTGRPSSIRDQTCTTPLPIPVEEEHFQSQHAVNLLGSEMQKNARYPGLVYRSPTNLASTPSSSDRSRSASKPTRASRSPSTTQLMDFEWAKNVPPSTSLYFLHDIQLTKIAQSILDRLYTPEAIATTWSKIQSTILELDQQISEWHSHLPGVFDFKRKQRDQTFAQERMRLGFFYYRARILIHRPCLCRMDRKIPSQSAKSREINGAAAAACIDAARDMLQLLPDEPNAVGLNSVGPWWCALHCLMQSTVVLLLELSFRADHMPEEAENIFEATKKAVRWMHGLGEESYSARRAWALVNEMFRAAAPKIGRTVSNLPEQPPGPLNEPPFYSNPGSSYFPTYSAATSGPMQTALQSGDNFTLPQQDMEHLSAYTGYDEYGAFPGAERPMTYPVTSVEMEFMSDAYHDPQQSDYSEQYYSGG